MLLFIKNVFRNNFLISVFFALGLLLSFDSYGQVGLTGSTSVIQGSSYTYYPSYNGSSTYMYNGYYSYTITGGVVTGTSNTTKSGTCTSVLYSIGINVTWTSSTGSLYFTCNLGSKTINITAPPALQPGTLSPSSQTINYGTAPSTITGTAATGGAASPTYNYLWYNSADGVNWSSLGITTQNYSPGNLNSSTYYRRQVTETTTGSTAYTSSVFVSVYPQLSVSISPTTQNITAGTAGGVLTPSLSGGNGTYTYQWQTSPNGSSSWGNVGTSSSYNPGIINQATYIRLIVTSNGVNATSNTAVINTCSAPAGQIVGPTHCVTGSSIQLANATGGGSWSSSDANVATISSSGVVTGKMAGTAVITYSVTNACGTSSIQLTITVVPFHTLASSLGRGVQDPILTDTISLVQGTTKITQFTQDTLYSAAHTIKNVLAFRLIEESNKYIPGDFVATAVVKLEYGHSATELYQVDSIKLKISYNKNQGTKYDALNYFAFDNAEFTRITVLRIEAPTTVNGTSFDTKQVLLLTNALAGTRYYQLADNKKAIVTITAPPAIPVPDELPVSWVFPNYTLNNGTQLEWTWLEDEMENSYNVNGVLDTALLFKTGATRLDLPGSAQAGAYKIPTLYDGKGKLYLRVRATNTMPSGSRSDGPWSIIKSYVFNGHADSLNWQSTTTYAEDGKRKTVIQYYDGSLRGRQTVTKDNVTGKTIVAETLYDGQGRPAVQILPAPGISNIISYTRELNKFNLQPDSTNPLDYFDFSTPSLGGYATTPLSQSNGTARYYSRQNSDTTTIHDKNIPFTNGYPYSVTRYTPDGTGRVMRQGGVGDSLQIGGDHATRYFYSSAEKERLYALFGTEVGNSTHYFKNMVQDANGQMSVSYVDMHGRTVATALAGDAPVGIQALAITDTAIYKNQAGKLLTTKLLDKTTNILKEYSIESISSVPVAARTNYAFNYQLSNQTLQLPKCGGGTVSYTCKFDLQISIADETGDSTAVVYNYNGISSIDFQQSLILMPGSYLVRKTLTINQDSLEKFMLEYNTYGVGICQTQLTLIDSIATADSLASNCNTAPTPVTHTSCLASLGTYTSYLNTYVLSLGFSSSAQLSASQLADIRNQYVSDSTFCVSLNPNASGTLKTIRNQMLADMVPYSGQYAKESGSGTMHNKFSIFSLSGSTDFATQPFYKNPRLTPNSLDFYYTQMGVVDSTVLSTRLSSMTMQQFADDFKESWTKSLLLYHPEYKKLKLAEDSLRSSFNYIDSINVSVSTAFSPINTDPFFSAFSSSATDKNLMKKYSDTSWQNGYSMWQLAYAEAFGCKAQLTESVRSTCYSNMPKQFTATGTVVNTGAGNVTLTATIQANAWGMYKAFYTQVRGEMVNRWINLKPPTTDTTNNSSLITQGYQLHFPYNNVQRAQDLGWTNWYPNAAGVYPVFNVVDSAKKVKDSVCYGYIQAWRDALLGCPILANMSQAARETILNSITSKMLLVCRNGLDAANPYGASTVSPANAGATYKSFEEVINTELESAGIPNDTLFCNPFVIEYPKKYGRNQPVTKQYITSIDTCNCSQFSKIRTEATTAEYYAYSLPTLNQYLSQRYQDTLSATLYQALEQCYNPYVYRCRDTAMWLPGHPGHWYWDTIQICDTLISKPLANYESLPIFMTCNFDDSSYTCFDCNFFKTLQTNFYSIFGRNPVFTGTITDDTTLLYNDLFAKFVNFRTGLHKNWQYYAERFNTTSCGVGGLTGSGTGLSICLEHKPLNDTTGFVNNTTPCQDVRDRAGAKAAIIFEYNRVKGLANFSAAYIAKCLQSTESFTVTDTVKEYHYTLYYYDQAGNLIKTVPPAGVNPIYRQTWIDSVEAAKESGAWLVPQHKLASRYNYNSLNQVVLQNTPDGGTSRFYYDRLGRLSISQNAKQVSAGNVYSYTKYESLGRMTEVGQIIGGSAMTDATAKNAGSLETWLTNAANTRNQVTETVFDLEHPTVTAMVQRNLRNRVSYSQVYDLITEMPASGTLYSYDIHGNVDSLLQDFGNSAYKPNAMNQSSNRFKKIVYDYDLVSGKVNQVSYQRGEKDAYYHRYSYDADNRITDVITGRDSVMLFFFPERDAKYTYYKHGPLARTELGKLRVQGLDYAYTMQGWLKAINPVMGGMLANGTDSTEAYPVAQDVFGFSLNYYKNDYEAIGYDPPITSIVGALASNAAPLYNGNIAAIAVNIPQLGSSKVYNYKYDQLNRLVAMDVYNGLNVNAGSFTPVSINDYRERISYDANGNILSYERNGDAARLSMDNLSYFYKANTNQLHKVTDAAADAATADYSKYNDLKQGQSDNNYQFDQIGNLVSDASESITNISWTVYGKIQSITKNGQLIKYVYDASGNRILKLTASDTTAYVRDASGNVLSVYSKTTSTPLVQSETHLYGSSRLGISTQHLAPDTTFNLSSGFGAVLGSIFVRGEKLFELSNHLGNVLVTVTDRRFGIDGNSDGVIDYFKADISTANDYYPFGMLMPKRSYSGSGAYRYGFNGKENDNDVKGLGNQQDYGMRIYDPRLGRFLSTDPLTKSFAWYTPYQFAGNSPIWAIDLDGLEPVTCHALTPTHLRPKLKASEWYEVLTKGGGHFTDETSFAAAARYNTANNNTAAYQTIAHRNSWYSWSAKETKEKGNYWFAAARDVTSWTMVGAADMPNLWFMYDSEENILRGANKFLLQENFKNFGNYALGKGPVTWNGNSYGNISGAELDNQMVVIEMTTLQGYLNEYKTTYIKDNGEEAWNKLNKGLNKLFSNKFLAEATPASNQYAQQEFIKKYGKDVQFDFMNLEHRIFQGQKMAEFLRAQDEKQDNKKSTDKTGG